MRTLSHNVVDVRWVWVRLWVAIALCAAMGCDAGEASGPPRLPECAAGAECATVFNGIAAAPPCLPHELMCSGVCTDVQSNIASCGGCGLPCASGQLCQAGTCTDVCGSGLGHCGGQCVNLSTHPTHCGTCDNACPAGQLCVSGVCSATCEQTVCAGASGPECVSLVDNRSHCGACNAACSQTDACVGGTCVLDCGVRAECNRRCVDLQSDDANCGACGMACAAGMTCQAGACTCANGYAACRATCIDTTSDPENCGACGNGCGNGYLCEGGRCVGPDGCTETPATGLTLSAIDVYQSVQIPIMEEGDVVAAGDRNADVVVGRKTVFRVHVTPQTGWTPREDCASNVPRRS